MISNRIAIILVAVGVVAGHGVASAAEITQSGSFGFGWPNSTNLSFDQFDDQGGTRMLNSVSLTLDGTIQTHPVVTNAVDATNKVSVTLTGNVNATGPSSLNALLFGLTATTKTVTLQAAGPASEYDFGVISDSGANTAKITTGLSAFIGSGNVDVTVEADGGVQLQKQDEALLSVAGKTTSGTTTLVYDYTAPGGTKAP
jgi:hypothetical protein